MLMCSCVPSVASEQSSSDCVFKPSYSVSSCQRAPSNQVFCPVDDAKVETKKSQCNHESRTVNKCGNNGINVGILVGIIPTSHQIQEAFSYIIASFSLIAISIIKRPIRKFPSCLIIVFCDI